MHNVPHDGPGLRQVRAGGSDGPGDGVGRWVLPVGQHPGSGYADHADDGRLHREAGGLVGGRVGGEEVDRLDCAEVDVPGGEGVGDASGIVGSVAGDLGDAGGRGALFDTEKTGVVPCGSSDSATRDAYRTVRIPIAVLRNRRVLTDQNFTSSDSS